MPVHQVDDPADPRLADFRDIPDPELVRRRGLFVAEGRLVVQRLLDCPRFRTRALLVTEAALAPLREALARAEAGARAEASARAEAGARAEADAARGAIDVFVAPRGLIAAIGGFDFHRGCLAIAERPDRVPLGALAASAPGDRLLVLEAIANADNVGGIFRNAAAFGARGVVLDGRTCDPFYRKATRTSMGATLAVPFATCEEWPAALRELRAAGYTLAALTPAHDAVDVDAAAASLVGRPVALLVGSEGAGLSAESLALAECRVRIAMAPGIDSLNVATATGIALRAFARRG